MAGQTNSFYDFGSFRIDRRERLLVHNGEPVPLPPKVYDTLLALVESCGHVVEKEELMKRVWPDTFVEEANLTVNISALRKALGEGEAGQHYIETVPRRGYRFVAAVTEVKDSSADVSTAHQGSFAVTIDEARKVDAAKDEAGYPGAVRSALRRGWILGISALLLGFAAVAYYTWTKRATGGPKVRSIAVLPFKPLVADNRDEPLEMGMCDALITRLGGLNQLVVRPTSSVVRYNKLGQDPLAAGRELGVDALLDGYVQRSGDKIRVTAQLLSTSDGKHLWSSQFNENFTDIFAVEDSISRQMVEALLLNLTGEEQRRVTRHYTEDIDAYQFYLKGRYFLDKRTPESLKKSIDYFQQAIETDPNYAIAFAGLADSYRALAIRADMRPIDSTEKAKAAAIRALEIDDTLAEAHSELAYVKYWNWEWVGAESEFRRAIELNANNASAHDGYAIYLMAIGRRQEAISEIKLAQRLEPLSLNISHDMARILYFEHEYDEAIDQCRKNLEMEPNYGVAHFFLGRSYSQKRMFVEALSELQRARELVGEVGDVLSEIGYTYAAWGQRPEAQKLLAELQRLSKQRYISPYHIAMVYAGLGEHDKAFEFLEKAYEDREGRMTILKYAPEFDNLHSDSRYPHLIRRIGLIP